jgi:hypothetical protein
MLMTPGGTLQFKYRVHLPANQDRAHEPTSSRLSSRKVINDDQWHTVRFTRSGVSEFAFSFDGVQENNIAIEVPSGNVVDISGPRFQRSSGSKAHTFRIGRRSRNRRPARCLTLCRSQLASTLQRDLFSFDTATGGNVMLGDFLVDKFGCARNTTLCQSCSFCNQKYENNTQSRFFDTWGNPYAVWHDEVSRAACPAKNFFVPREEGACCGHCFYPNEPIKFCKYRSCMRDFIGAHQCKECGIANAEIQCAREQSAECGAQTEAYCKLSTRSNPCACDGKIAKLPLVCSNKTQPYEEYCVSREDGSLKVLQRMREYAECAGSNGRKFELDINRTECSLIEPGRKRNGIETPCAETNTTTTTTNGAPNQRAGIIVFTLVAMSVLAK